MKALQQSLVDTLSSACLGPTGSGNIADYIGQMAIAMGKLATLKNFLQAMHSAHVPPTFQPHSRTANAIAPNVPHSALDAHFFFNWMFAAIKDPDSNSGILAKILSSFL